MTADATAGLLRLGQALLEAYAGFKRSLARLDYDDLILMTADLLDKPNVAPWILFKLDGGIDHILIDEAQDTSPQQWAVVAKLAEEFFTGEGARRESSAPSSRSATPSSRSSASSMPTPRNSAACATISRQGDR